jgi:hypothetical protein
MLDLIRLVIGAVLLFLGKRVYWMLVGLLGFAAGLAIGARLFPESSDLVVLLAALVGGVIGALLAGLVQRIAVAAAGFFAGGFAAVTLWELLLGRAGGLDALAFILGGIVGAVLTIVLFDWALIGLSSLVGSSMIVQALDLPRGLAWVVLIVLFVGGIIVQSATRPKAAAPPPAPTG